MRYTIDNTRQEKWDYERNIGFSVCSLQSERHKI